MSRIIKLVKTLRNNWKKTIFFSGLAAFGAYYGHGKYLEFNVMRAYCQEAQRYGTEKLLPFHKARHVTVLLNPVANKKKGKADFEKYCAPIFHLAGLKVSLVVTEAEGQARDLMEIMSDTDCVVVAGGDGTLQEAITGLLRRSDSHLIDLPLGIIPIGRNNSVAYKLNAGAFDAKVDSKAKMLAESAMLVVRQELGQVDVMKIEGELGRPVYSLGHLNVGQIQNTMQKVDQYWYLGQWMKPYLTFFFQSFKNLSADWDENETVTVNYTKPCSGCSKCYHLYHNLTSVESEMQPVSTGSTRWWHVFLPRSKAKFIDPVKESKIAELEHMKSTINEECDQWQTISIKAKNILLRHSPYQTELELIVHPPDLKRNTFVREGTRLFRCNEFEGNELPYQLIKAKACNIEFPVKQPNIGDGEESDLEQVAQTEAKMSILKEIEYRPTAIKEIDADEEKEVNETDHSESNATSEPISINDASTKWFAIDNESYELMSSLQISLLPKRIQIYHNRQDR